MAVRLPSVGSCRGTDSLDVFLNLKNNRLRSLLLLLSGHNQRDDYSATLFVWCKLGLFVFPQSTEL